MNLTDEPWMAKERERIKNPHVHPESPAGKGDMESQDYRLRRATKKLRDANIFLHPWKYGAWVSLTTGELYVGHGGNEREEQWLEKEGPWTLMNELDYERIRDTYRSPYKEEVKQHIRLRDKLRELLNEDE